MSNLAEATEVHSPGRFALLGSSGSTPATARDKPHASGDAPKTEPEAFGGLSPSASMRLREADLGLLPPRSPTEAASQQASAGFQRPPAGPAEAPFASSRGLRALAKDALLVLYAGTPFLLILAIGSDLVVNNALNDPTGRAWWIRLAWNAGLGVVAALVPHLPGWVTAFRQTVRFFLRAVGYELHRIPDHPAWRKKAVKA